MRAAFTQGAKTTVLLQFCVDKLGCNCSMKRRGLREIKKHVWVDGWMEPWWLKLWFLCPSFDRKSSNKLKVQWLSLKTQTYLSDMLLGLLVWPLWNGRKKVLFWRAGVQTSLEPILTFYCMDKNISLYRNKNIYVYKTKDFFSKRLGFELVCNDYYCLLFFLRKEHKKIKMILNEKHTDWLL